MDVEFAVLGELRVVIGGIDVTPRAAKERALLALLALQRGRAVVVDRLLDELWPDLPPERARRVLQVRVSEIRNRFAQAGAVSLLESVPGGYRLCLTGGALDVDRFDALVASARTKAEAGDTMGAAADLRRALDLWRGDAFADVRGTPAVEQEAARLTELRLAAIEAWGHAELESGRHTMLCAELEGLAAAHPFAERLWGLWMLALYRAGRQADALAAYQRIRELLGDELGLQPSQELRDLERAILMQDPDLDWPGPPATAPADGPREVGAAGPVLHNLPVADPLVGRADDVAAVVDLLGSHRLVTVTGPPGVGKSRLALAVACRQVGGVAACDGVWLVELAPLGEPTGLVGALAAALPLPSMPTSAAELVDQIGARAMLIVLDNCEHLVEDVAMLVSQLLATCPAVRVMCTSQETLTVDREHVWPLQPLDSEAAAELFVARAEAVRPAVTRDPEAVALIVRRLDGLPLAIELAAARVSTMSPAEIVAQLDDRFRLLWGAVRGRHPRHRALAAMVDWGHELLESNERRLFRRLGVFTGSFTRDAAVEITDIEGDDPTTLANDLDHLVRRSLVVADSGPDSTRYRLLETLRFYALDRLAEAGETDVVGRRHADWYADFALNFEAVHGPDETLWLAKGIAEFDNLRGAVAYAVSRGDTDLAVRLVGRLWPLGVLWRSELLDWARQTLALPGAADHDDVGYVHVIVAQLTRITGDSEGSLRASEEALLRPLDGDAWTWATFVRIAMLVYVGRQHETPAVRRAALARLRDVRQRTLLLAMALGGEAYTGYPPPVGMDEVIADADATGNLGLRVFSRTMAALGLVARQQSNAATAIIREALEIGQPSLNRWALGIANEVLALVAGTATDARASSGLAEQAAKALDLTREYPMGMGFSLIGLIVAADHQGSVQEAAMLAGHVTGHLDELQLTAKGAERMAGRPLDRFLTPITRAEYERGKAMTTTDLRRELERLASPDTLAEVVPIKTAERPR